MIRLIRAGAAALLLLTPLGVPPSVGAQEPARGADPPVADGPQRAWTGALPTLLWGVATAMIEAGDGLAGPEAAERLAAARLAADVAVEGSRGTAYAPLATAAALALDTAAADPSPAAGVELMERGQALVLLVEEGELAGLAGHPVAPEDPDAVIGHPVINALGSPVGEVAALATAPDGEKLALITVAAPGAQALTIALPAEVLVVGSRAVALASFLSAEALLKAAGDAADGADGQARRPGGG